MANLVFQDYELQYYINRGFTVGALDDRARLYYISVLPVIPGVDYQLLTTTDLEMKALQVLTASSSVDIDDLWFAYLDPLFGPGKSVQDLRYELYAAG
jgi:hypothetical protein